LRINAGGPVARFSAVFAFCEISPTALKVKAAPPPAGGGGGVPGGVPGVNSFEKRP